MLKHVVLIVQDVWRTSKIAFRNQRSFTPIVWIPPIYTPNVRITVERSDGTVDDITDEIIDFRLEDGATETIGNFEFAVPNTNNQYTSAWSGMEIVRFFSDYAPGTPTTLRFRGRIEKPSKQGNNVKVTGRVETLFVFDQKITKTYTAQDVGFIVKDLFDNYGGSRFDTSSVPLDTEVVLTVEWVDKNFWEAITDICNQAGYDCFVDSGLVVQFFEQGSVNNTEDAIVHENNLMETGDFAPDIQFVKNKVRVYGSSIGGVQIIYTANDLDSQASRGVRRENIKDDSITSYALAKELGDFKLAELKDPPQVGEVKSFLIATIQPGENLRISDPDNGITPGFYRIIKYTHEISQENGFLTTVVMNKEPKRISHVFKEQISSADRKTGVIKNNYDMDFSTTELFDADTGTHSNTEITDGLLQKESAGSDGTWISTTFQTPDGLNVSQLVFRAQGDNITGSTYEVSLDGGVSFETVSVDELVTPTATSGGDIVVKVTVSDDDSKIDSYEVQFITS